MKVEPLVADVGEKITLTGSVKTVNGDPVPDALVSLEMGIDKKPWTQFATTQTDPQGEYVTSTTFDKPGKFLIRANFFGA